MLAGMMFSAPGRQKETTKSLAMMPWATRHFLLTGGLALYFDGEACKGAIYVEGGTTQPKTIGSRPHCIARARAEEASTRAEEYAPSDARR